MEKRISGLFLVLGLCLCVVEAAPSLGGSISIADRTKLLDPKLFKTLFDAKSKSQAQALSAPISKLLASATIDVSVVFAKLS